MMWSGVELCGVGRVGEEVDLSEVFGVEWVEVTWIDVCVVGWGGVRWGGVLIRVTFL